MSACQLFTRLLAARPRVCLPPACMSMVLCLLFSLFFFIVVVTVFFFVIIILFLFVFQAYLHSCLRVYMTAFYAPTLCPPSCVRDACNACQLCCVFFVFDLFCVFFCCCFFLLVICFYLCLERTPSVPQAYLHSCCLRVCMTAFCAPARCPPSCVRVALGIGFGVGGLVCVFW